MMAEYYEDNFNGDILRKFDEINELFISIYNIATYGGCEFGCAYCDAWSYSDQAINKKICSYSNLLKRLPMELENIESDEAIGFTFSDPYQPAEKHFRLTRKTLQLLKKHNRSVFILTKSPSVIDDLDLIREMNKNSFAIVATTIVTLKKELLAHLEYQVPVPEDRINTIGMFKQSGIPSGIVLNPIIPYLTDDRQDIFNLLETVSKISPDFIVWDYLWIPNQRHRKQIENFLSSIDNKIIDKFDALYMNNPQPSYEYRKSMDRFLIESCRKLGLESRIPVKFYKNYLNPEKVLMLKEKQRLFFTMS
jgi:DNA repair photolyase